MKLKPFISKTRNKARSSIICICLIAFLSFFYLLGVTFDIFGFRVQDRDIKLQIESETSKKQIATVLKNEKIINCEFPFLVALKLSKNAKNIKEGEHLLKSQMTYGKIFKELTQDPPIECVKVLIPEGFEVWQIAKRLSNNGLVNEESFLKKLESADFPEFGFVSSIKRRENRLEGYLFPATYSFENGESEESIINKMLKKFSLTVIPLYEDYKSEYDKNQEQNKANKKPYSLDEIVTLASIIERETFGPDMPIISSVFHNRLKNNMYLGSCATVLYATKNRKDVISVGDTKIMSPYNTYMYKNLPIGPISCPGKDAIIAAMNPAASDYLYFVKNHQGTAHIFSRSLNEHNRFLKPSSSK